MSKFMKIAQMLIKAILETNMVYVCVVWHGGDSTFVFTPPPIEFDFHRDQPSMNNYTNYPWNLVCLRYNHQQN